MAKAKKQSKAAADREGGESPRFKKSEKVAYTPPSERKKPKRGK